MKLWKIFDFLGMHPKNNLQTLEQIRQGKEYAQKNRREPQRPIFKLPILRNESK
jgi:hypothetical protein